MSKDKIEFDKSKVLTAVTADQAKVGDVGWFADNLEDLRNHVASGKPETIKGIMDESESYRFLKYNSKWTLFYPAPYSYRPFTDDEMEELVGKVLVRNEKYPEEDIRKVLVTGYGYGKIVVASTVGDLFYDSEGVFKTFVTEDGTPAGVKL